MTGCPNGFARPYNADIGLVGRSAPEEPRRHPRPRHVHDLPRRPGPGDRLNVEFKDYVPFDRVVPSWSPSSPASRPSGAAGETFGDYCHRVGVEALGGEPSPA